MAIPRYKTHFLVVLVATLITTLKRWLVPLIARTSGLLAPKRLFLGALAAPGTAYHAQYAAGAPIASTTGFAAMPFPRRTVQCVLGTGGANPVAVTLTGTDITGAALIEVISCAGPGTYAGARVFGTLTAVSTAINPAGTLDVQTGKGFTPGEPFGALTTLSVNGVVEAAASSHPATGTVVPPTVPDGTRQYAVEYTPDTSGDVASLTHLDSDERVCNVANAVDLATSLVLAVDLLTRYAAHRVDVLHHVAADATNTVATAPSAVVDLPSAIAAANQIKAALNAHRVSQAAHVLADIANVITSADAADQASLITLLNEIKVDFNGHCGAGVSSPAAWRVLDA